MHHSGSRVFPTFGAITEAQYVSLDTIRSQRLSLYPKLGAHSPGEGDPRTRAGLVVAPVVTA
jgi:hypothetical protein